MVALVRRLTGTTRVGHGGTLDPVRVRGAADLPRQGHARGRVPPRRDEALPRDGLLRRVLHDRRSRGRADARRRVAAPITGCGRGGARGVPRRDARSGRRRSARSRSAAAGPTRWHAPARRPNLAPRTVTIHEIGARSTGTASDPARPIATIDVDVLRRHVHPRHRTRPRRGGRQRRVPRRASSARRAARSARRRGRRSTRFARRQRPAATRCAALLLPVDAGLEAFPVVRDLGGGTGGRRPGPVRPPGAGLPTGRRAGRDAPARGSRRHPRGARPDPRGPGSCPTRSSSTSGRRGPRRPPASRRPRCRPPRPPRAGCRDGACRRPATRASSAASTRSSRATVRCSSSSACSTASTAATPICSTRLRAEAERARRAGRRSITFDAHPDEILRRHRAADPVRPGRAARPAGGGRRRGDGRPALRSRPAHDAVRGVRRDDHAPDRASPGC